MLGLRAAILQKGPSLQPAELQCKNLLKSQIFSGGLQLLQPSNPFDEEKGEARSSTSTAGSTPTDASYQIPTSDLLQTAVGPHMVSNNSDKCLLLFRPLLFLSRIESRIKLPSLK